MQTRKVRQVRVADIRALQSKALAAGALPSPETRDDHRPVLLWSIAPWCASPPRILCWGREIRAIPVRINPATGEPFLPMPRRTEVLLEVACRKCRYCHKVRRNMWYKRASAEYVASPRTWFATLTIRPEDRYRARLEAIAATVRKGSIWDELTEEQQFQEMHLVYSAEIAKFYKRVRWNSGALLRHLTVCEKHKSGDHHYHALIHETSSAHVEHSVLTDAWKLGFSKFKLLKQDSSSKAVLYVLKYLSKESAARVRASQHYGEPPYRNGLPQTASVNSSANERPESESENKGGLFCASVKTSLKTDLVC